MVDLKTAENALKDAYLVAICNQLNTKTNPLFAKIKQSSADVYGKQIIKVAPVGLNGGIGAGSETGLLPTANENNYAQFKTTLKNLYGTIELSDKVIRASSASNNFINILNAEMEGLLEASKFNLGRMLYGDGSGKLATVSSFEGNEATVDSVKNLIEGMVVDVYTGKSVNKSGLRIAYVDRENKKISFTTTVSGILESDEIYVQGSRENEITGLGALFNTSSETLYGLTRATNKWLNPYVSNTSQEINDAVLQTAVDFLEENTGSTIDFITCSGDVKRAYQEYLSYYRRNVDVTELEGGYKAITFNGIPLVSDRFIPEGTLYMLDTKKFTLHQLCDWEWIQGESGNILRQKPG